MFRKVLSFMISCALLFNLVASSGYAASSSEIDTIITSGAQVNSTKELSFKVTTRSVTSTSAPMTLRVIAPKTYKTIFEVKLTKANYSKSYNVKVPFYGEYAVEATQSAGSGTIIASYDTDFIKVMMKSTEVLPKKIFTSSDITKLKTGQTFTATFMTYGLEKVVTKIAGVAGATVMGPVTFGFFLADLINIWGVPSKHYTANVEMTAGSGFQLILKPKSNGDVEVWYKIYKSNGTASSEAYSHTNTFPKYK